MCEPISLTLLSMGLGIAGQVGQFQNAQAQAEYQNQLHKVNSENAAKSFAIETRQLTDRQQQEQEASAQRTMQMRREYDATRESAINTAGEKGISGITLDGLLNDVGMQQNDRVNAENTNLSWTLNQLQTEKEGQGTNMWNRINSVPKGQKPNMASLAIGIGGEVVGGITNYKKLSAQQAKGMW